MSRTHFTSEQLAAFDAFLEGLHPGNVAKRDTVIALRKLFRVPARKAFARANSIDPSLSMSRWTFDQLRSFLREQAVMPILKPRSEWLKRSLIGKCGAEVVTRFDRLAAPGLKPTQTPYPAPAPAAPARIDEATIKRLISEVLDGQLGDVKSSALSGVKEMIAATQKMLEERVDRSRLIEIAAPGKPKKKVKDLVHRAFETVLKLASARVHVLLIGPAGSGKSHLAAQVAKALDLDFYFINCSEGMSESKLEGYLAPTGDAGRFEFITTDFIRAYEEGGLFLLDELDACDPNVLLVVNAALANGHLALPKRYKKPVAKRHKDFVLIASANTYGTGANRMYVGRNQLDEATLDRFRMGQIEMDFDHDLETSLVADEEIRTSWWKVRAKVNEMKLRRVISTRTMVTAATQLKPAGFTLQQCLTQLTLGWSDDELSRVGLRSDRSWR